MCCSCWSHQFSYLLLSHFLGWPYKLNQLDQNIDPSSSCKCKKTLNWFWSKYFKRTKLHTLTGNLLIAKGDVTVRFWRWWLKSVLAHREFCSIGGFCPILWKHILLFRNSFLNYCLLSRSSLLSLHASAYFSWVSLPVAKPMSTRTMCFLIDVLGRAALTVARKVPDLPTDRSRKLPRDFCLPWSPRV